jgi:hypothetical protein
VALTVFAAGMIHLRIGGVKIPVFSGCAMRMIGYAFRNTVYDSLNTIIVSAADVARQKKSARLRHRTPSDEIDVTR